MNHCKAFSVGADKDGGVEANGAACGKILSRQEFVSADDVVS